jgi:hypothetical protein
VKNAFVKYKVQIGNSKSFALHIPASIHPLVQDPDNLDCISSKPEKDHKAALDDLAIACPDIGGRLR